MLRVTKGSGAWLALGTSQHLCSKEHTVQEIGSGHLLFPGDGNAGLAQELGPPPLPATSVAVFGGCSVGGRSPRRGADGTGPRLAAATSVLCVPKPLELCVPGAGARAGGGRGSRAQVALRGAGCGDRDGLAEAGKVGRGTPGTAELLLVQVWVSGCCSGRCAKLGVGPARENCGGCCSSTGGEILERFWGTRSPLAGKEEQMGHGVQ